MRLVFGFALVLITFFAVPVAWAQSDNIPIRGDYNGDGVADLSVALVDRATNSTAWLTRHGRNNFSFWTFATAGDALVAGHWYGNQRYYPGIVYVKNLQVPLEWRLKNPQGQEVILPFGLPGDSIPNQGDFDCDGITDFAVTRNVGAYKYWFTTMSSAGGQVVQQLFGLAGDQAGTADMDGDGCHELVVLRDSYFWFSKKLFGTDVSMVQWGLPGDLPLWPQDINGDGRADYVVSRRTGVGQVGYVRYGDGPSNFTTFSLGFDSSIPQIGRFRGGSFFAWHQRDSGWVAVGDRNRPGNIGELLQFGIPSNAIIRSDGSVVQPTEDGRFPGSNNGGGDVGSGPFGCTVTTDFRDGSGGALWKPVSESTGNPVFLLAASYWAGPTAANRLELLDRNGALAATIRRRSCCPNDNRSHFDVTTRAAALVPAAPLTVRMYLNNNTVECRTVPNPTQRYD